MGSGLVNLQERYCANLVHKCDLELDQISMRAQYYVPCNGRFISDDPALDRKHWYAYHGNHSVNRVDEHARLLIELSMQRFATGFMIFFLFTSIGNLSKDTLLRVPTVVVGAYSVPCDSAKSLGELQSSTRTIN